MAPMAGVTDVAFRERLRRNGCKAIWTEMVSAAALVRRHKNSIKMINPEDLDDATALQLFGAKPLELRDAALMAADCGWVRLDLNMGCPVKKVVKSGSGAALMRDLALASECIRAVRGVFPGMLTVKFRLGWNDGERNYLELAALAEGEGADGLILHGRTRVQGYGGEADWGAVAELKRASRVPVAGNGDVDGPKVAFDRLESSGADAVMIGRAALARPWIFRDCERMAEGLPPHAPPEREELIADLLAHLERLCELKGTSVAVAEMKKFVAWADKGGQGAAERRNSIMRASTKAEMEAGIRQTGGATSG